MDIVPVKPLSHIEQFLRSFTSENTRSAYARDLKEYTTFTSTMDPFSFAALVQYRDALLASSAPGTAARKCATVKSFLSFLASEGYIKVNPAINFKLPKNRPQAPTEAFSDEEVRRVMQAVDPSTFAGNAHRLILALLFNLGLRRSELVNLRLSSYQEHRGTQYLSVVGKGDKHRMIPLTKEMRIELEGYVARYQELTGYTMQPQDFLIQSSPDRKNEKPFNPNSIYRIVKQYAQDAGVTKRVSPHSCRATVISHLLEKEVSPRAVADMVGHASIQTTVGIYDRKRDALSNTAASKVSYGC